MLKVLSELDKHRELLGLLVARNIKVRYKRSVLGFFWTLLHPLFFIVIYVTFLKLVRLYDKNDPLFLPGLVTGVIVWQFMAMCLNDSLHAVVSNANLVTKTAFPRIALPLSMSVANLVNFLLSLCILAAYLVVEGASFSYVAMLPAVIATQFALCLGLSLILSSLNVYFRDVEHLLGVAMLAWFFLTPIIYPFERIPIEYQKLAFLNPMTGIVIVYKSALLGTSLMAPRLVLASLAIPWVACAAGIVVFQRLQRRFAEEM